MHRNTIRNCSAESQTREWGLMCVWVCVCMCVFTCEVLLSITRVSASLISHKEAEKKRLLENTSTRNKMENKWKETTSRIFCWVHACIDASTQTPKQRSLKLQLLEGDVNVTKTHQTISGRRCEARLCFNTSLLCYKSTPGRSRMSNTKDSR